MHMWQRAGRLAGYDGLRARRMFGKQLAALCTLGALPWPAAAKKPTARSFIDPVHSRQGAALLRISVHLPEGGHFSGDAHVYVSGPGGVERLKRCFGSQVYESWRGPGIYFVNVEVPGYRAMQRRVPVDSGVVPVLFYLGRDDWPSYYMGGVEVPFAPTYGLAAAAFMVPPSAESIKKARADLEKHGLRVRPTDPGNPGDLDDADGQILYIEGDQHHPDRDIFARDPTQVLDVDLPSTIATAFQPFRARVGVPISTRRGAVRILDAYFEVAFPELRTDEEVARLLKSWNADPVGRVEDQVAVWRIRFRDAYNYKRHLALLSQLVRGCSLRYAEPSILFQLSYHGCSEVALDPCFPHQDQPYFGRQNVSKAWCYIEDHVSSAIRHGDPGICVATVDKGITYSSENNTSSHPDVNVDRIAGCVNFRSADTKCTGEIYIDVHGMGVYGIIAATSNNGVGISGIAPNTTHVAVRYKNLTDPDLYRSMLLWLAGLPGALPASPNFGYAPDVEPLARPADVINCSHSWAYHPVSTSILDALQRLAQCARGGKGAVVVYSAGNDGSDIQGVHELAANQHVIAVGNTYIQNGIEKRHPTSNFGSALDLCAMAEQVPTLHPDPSKDFLKCSTETPSGAFRFFKTSAAAPMVSAAAALMLSVNPALTRTQIREIICGAADRPGDGVTAPDLDEGTWDTSTWSNPVYGHGRLNVERAVRIAHGYTTLGVMACT